MGAEAAASGREAKAVGRATGGGTYPPQAGAVPALSSEQERVLLEHLPIVRFLARRIHERLPQHVDIEDLVSAGVVGLMDAFAKFDPDKKVQFRSYAQFRIRGAILDSLRTLACDRFRVLSATLHSLWLPCTCWAYPDHSGAEATTC